MSNSQTTTQPPPRLLDQLREMALAKYGRPEPGNLAVEWVRRFILFHGKRHPNTMREAEILVNWHVSASTQNQAFNAILFLYQQVLPLDE